MSQVQKPTHVSMSQVSLVEQYRERILAPERRELGFHVTSLLYDCVRRCFYNVTEEPRFDTVTQIKLNLGSLIHKHYRLDGATHELKLQWDGIIGSMDVYNPETGEVVDLKSVWTPGRYIKELPYEHHKRQLEYYSLLLAKNNLKVGPLNVLYVPINVAKTIKPRPVEEIEAEVSAKVQAIRAGQDSKIPPPPLLKSRECGFCPYLRLCDKQEKQRTSG